MFHTQTELKRNVKELIKASRLENLFVRLTHHRLWQYLILVLDLNIWYAAISFMRLLLFRNKSGAAICIKKNSATLWTGKSSDETGRAIWKLTIGEFTQYSRYTMRVHSIIPSLAVGLASMLFKATLQCIKRYEISAREKCVSSPSDLCLYVTDANQWRSIYRMRLLFRIFPAELEHEALPRFPLTSSSYLQD